MSLRTTLPFLVAVFIVAIAGTFLAIQLFSGGAENDSPNVQLVTVQVIVTATQDPNATLPVRIITATPDRTQVAIPAGILPTNASAAVPLVTIDATALAGNPAAANTQAALPANCLSHTIAEGDTPFGVAVQYGADPFALMSANGLTDESATQLQIGDVIVVPLEGCPIETLPSFNPSNVAATEASAASPTPSPSPATTLEASTPTPGSSPTPSPSPTITLAPTAQNAVISIVKVDKPGDVTAEGVVIRNNGATVNLTGWTLQDGQGNEYTFGEQLLFSNGELSVFTRSGQNTPIVLYWGLDTPVWEGGDAVTLLNAQGVVQATFRVPSSSGLP